MSSKNLKENISHEQISQVTNLFSILSNPTRVKILWLLKIKQPLNVHEIQHKLKISQSNASQHLSILRKNKLIIEERKGKEVYYKLLESKNLSKVLSSAIHLIAYQLSTATELLSAYTEILPFWV